MSVPMATPVQEATLGRPARLAGLAATLVAVGLVRSLPLRRVISLVRAGRRHGRRPATPVEAARYLLQVEQGSGSVPFRVACLERSLAAVLLGIAYRRPVGWCIGVRITPPLTGHSWVQLDGQPVGEEQALIDNHRILLTVEER